MKNQLLKLSKQNVQMITRMMIILVAIGFLGTSAYAQIANVTPATRCGEGTVTLQATATTGTVTWYDVPFYGTALGTGTSFTTPSLSETKTYYVDAVDVSGCSVNTGPNDRRRTVVATVSAGSIQASIFYTSNAFCKSIVGEQAITRTGTAGGIYTVSPSGLTINATTGAITPSSSTENIYTVTYTITVPSEGCIEEPATTTVSITDAPLESSISYVATPYCSTLTSAAVTLANPNGGTFSASPSGLSIDVTSGTINPSLSLPGSYTVTYFVSGAGGCAPQTKTTPVTITGLPTAAISYTGTPFCMDNVDAQSPVLTGTGAYSGGAYSYTGTLLGTFNISTGAFIPSISTAGTYTITYTTPASGNCAAVAVNSSITINPLPTASISGGTTVCLNATEPNITFTGVTGTAPFTFTYNINSGTDKFVVTSSGNTVDVPQSTVSAGTYIYTLSSVSDANGCSQAVSGIPTQMITVTGPPVASFEYPSSLYCTTGTATPSFIGSGVAGAFTSSPAGLSIASGTGVINVALSASGTYTVTNTVSACGDPVVANVGVTINHVNPTISGSDVATCGSTTLTASSDATNASYIWYKNNIEISGQTAATLAVTATDSYKVQVTNTLTGCSETSASKTVTINALPVCSITGLSDVTYGSTNDYTATTGMSTYAWSISGDGTISGDANAQTVLIITSAAGAYTLSVTIINSNGCTSTCDKTVYVAQKALAITANDVNKTYGTAITGASGSTAFTSVGLEFTETIGTVTIAYGTGSAANAAVTTYADQVTASAAVGGTFTASNYSITYPTGDIIVGTKALAITANNVNKTYGTLISGAAGSTAFTPVGLQNDETIGSVTIAYGTGSAANAAVATYNNQVTASLATGGTFAASNYSITYPTGNIIVGTKALAITANNVNKTYGTLITGAAGSTAFTSVGLQNSETIGTVTIAYGTGSAASDGVAVYANQVTASAAIGGTFNASNYSITYPTGNITVTQATPTVSVTGGTYTYAAGTPRAATGFAYGYLGIGDVLSPAVTFSYVNSGGESYGPTSTAPIYPGVYVVTSTFAGNTNYTSASNTATITINPAAPSGTSPQTFCGN